MISIQIDGESDQFASIVEDAFKLARDAAASKTAINKTIVRNGARADVKVDP